MSITFSVFTKPWPQNPLAELGAFVKDMGFDGIELPIRPGYQVEPDTIATALPRAASQLSAIGVQITSVAAEPDEVTIAACGDAEVPVIRICTPTRADGYLASVAEAQRQYEAIVPLLDRHSVTMGIQNHSGGFVSHALGLHHLLEPFDPKHVAAVWCPAHNAIGGEFPDTAVDIVWPHLCQVKFKNVFWERKTGPEAEDVLWRPHWTSGRQGLASWPWVAEELRKRGFDGVVCLDAEYNGHDAVDELIAADISFARSLFS